MKLVAKLLVLCAIAYIAYAQGGSVQVNANVGCDTNLNKGLAWLKDQVPLTASEITLRQDSTTCAPEWSTYGTCCPADKIKTYISNLVNESATKWKNYIGKTKSLSNTLIPKIQRVMNKIQSNKAGFRNKAKTTSTTNGCNLNIFSDEAIDKIKAFIDSFGDKLKEYRGEGKQCFENIKRVKSNTICAICSGRGSTLYSTEQSSVNNGEAKLNIRRSVCRSILKDCGRVFRFNFYSQTSIELIQGVRFARGNGKGRKCTNNFDLDRINQINTAFKACVDANAVETCPDANVDVLCNSFVRLGGQQSAEGDSALVESEETQDTDAVSVEARLLQGTSTYNGGYGIEADSSSTAAGSDLMLSTSTNVVPTTSVDTATAFGFIPPVAMLASIIVLLASILL